MKKWKWNHCFLKEILYVHGAKKGRNSKEEAEKETLLAIWLEMCNWKESVSKEIWQICVLFFPSILMRNVKQTDNKYTAIDCLPS